MARSLVTFGLLCLLVGVVLGSFVQVACPRLGSWLFWLSSLGVFAIALGGSLL